LNISRYHVLGAAALALLGYWLVSRWQPRSSAGQDVVVMLHGYGASYDDLKGLVGDLKAQGAPSSAQYIHAKGPIAAGLGGRAWWNSAQDVEKSHETIAEFLSEHAAHGGGATVLIGFSQGAAAALEAALSSAGPVQCVAAISPVAHPRGPWSAMGSGGRGLRVFLAHGSADRVASPSMSAGLRKDLEALGIPVQLETHPGGHEIPPSVRRAVAAFVAECLAH